MLAVIDRYLIVLYSMYLIDLGTRVVFNVSTAKEILMISVFHAMANFFAKMTFFGMLHVKIKNKTIKQVNYFYCKDVLDQNVQDVA